MKNISASPLTILLLVSAVIASATAFVIVRIPAATDLSASAGAAFSCPENSADPFTLLLPQPSALDALRVAADNTEKDLSARRSALSLAHIRDAVLLARRKRELIELFYLDPDTAARHIFGKNNRFSDELLLARCAERFATAEGELEILHADFPDQRSVERYVLRTPSGQTLILHLPGVFAQRAAAHAMVRVRGAQIDNEFLVSPSNDDNFAFAPGGKRGGGGGGGGTTTTPPPTYATGTAPQRTLVVMAYFQGGGKPQLSKAKVDDVVFNQMNAYYYQTSYGVVSVPGTSIDWIQLPIAQTCSIYNTMSAVVSMVDASVYFPDYKDIVVVAPFGCGWGGVSWVGASNLYTADGMVYVGQALVEAGMLDKRVVGHEFGHSLGVHHAGMLFCGSNTFPSDLNYGGCTPSEYGDPYEIMGLGYGEMNAPHRESLRWFGATNLLRVTASGTYTIEPIEGTSTALKYLRIPRSPYDYTDIYVEYRQPRGEDKSFSNNVYSGPILHFPGGSKPQLLDATPPSDSASPALPPGRSVKDPLTGTTITTVSADTSGATISVALGKTDFSGPATTFLSPASASVVSGIVHIDVSLADPSGVTRAEYFAQGSTTPFAVQTAGPWGADFDTRTVANGGRFVTVKAYDNAGTPYGAENNMSSASLYLQVAN